MAEKGSTKVSKKSSKTIVTEALSEHVTWICGDCGNVYALDVRECPNDVIHHLIMNDLFDMALARRLT